ncbi:hypothetical protein, partial [Marinitenerispora sediminis]
MESQQELADRILAFDLSTGGRQRKSPVVLMREYLRRRAWWAREVEGAGWPFGDLAAAIDPAVRADPELVHRVRESFPYWVFGMVLDTCEWALHFRALQESGASLPDLPDPFEPLLLMYERGDGFACPSLPSSTSPAPASAGAASPTTSTRSPARPWTPPNSTPWTRPPSDAAGVHSTPSPPDLVTQGEP